VVGLGAVMDIGTNTELTVATGTVLASGAGPRVPWRVPAFDGRQITLGCQELARAEMRDSGERLTMGTERARSARR